MKVVGEGDQNKKARQATSVSSETPAGNHTVTKGLIKQCNV